MKFSRRYKRHDSFSRLAWAAIIISLSQGFPTTSNERVVYTVPRFFFGLFCLSALRTPLKRIYMKAIKRFAYTACLFICFASCGDSIDSLSPDLESSNTLKSFTQIKATVDEPPTTRAYMGNGRQISWYEGDEIGVYSDTQGVERFTRSTALGENAFQGNKMVGNQFFAYFPFMDGVNYVDETDKRIIHCQLANAWIGGEQGSFIKAPMVAKSSDNNFLFKPTYGLIHFQLTGSLKLTGINLTTVGNEVFNGNGYVDLSIDNPVFTIKQSSGKSSFDCPMPDKGYFQLEQESITDVYFALPVGIYEQGFKMTLAYLKDNNEESSVVKTTEKQYMVHRAEVLKFSTVNVDELVELDEPMIIGFDPSASGVNPGNIN